MNNVASWITFGKDKYHLQNEIAEWCRNNIGPGDWSYETPATWEGMNGKVWVMHSMFGNITYAFKESKHLTMFILKWG